MKVSNKPIKQLPIIYKKPNANLPFFINSKTSRLNVENVVKPPKKPTVINNFNVCEIKSDLFNKIPNIYPINREPIRLTPSVPKIDNENRLRHNMVTKYLKTAPMPPPINIEITFK